jgi:hypothetical protein
LEDVAGFGNNVTIVQGDTYYKQDVDFLVNYTKGEIIWISSNRPQEGSTYLITYTYFPKEILDHLFEYVTPATIRIIQQYAYVVSGEEYLYTPYFWNGSENPSGDVIM